MAPQEYYDNAERKGILHMGLIYIQIITHSRKNTIKHSLQAGMKRLGIIFVGLPIHEEILISCGELEETLNARLDCQPKHSAPSFLEGHFIIR